MPAVSVISSSGHPRIWGKVPPNSKSWQQPSLGCPKLGTSIDPSLSRLWALTRNEAGCHRPGRPWHRRGEGRPAPTACHDAMIRYLFSRFHCGGFFWHSDYLKSKMLAKSCAYWSKTGNRLLPQVKNARVWARYVDKVNLEDLSLYQIGIHMSTANESICIGLATFQYSKRRRRETPSHNQ